MDPLDAENDWINRHCFSCGDINMDRTLVHQRCLTRGPVYNGHCFVCGNDTNSAIDIFCPVCNIRTVTINEMNALIVSGICYLCVSTIAEPEEGLCEGCLSSDPLPQAQPTPTMCSGCRARPAKQGFRSCEPCLQRYWDRLVEAERTNTCVRCHRSPITAAGRTCDECHRIIRETKRERARRNREEGSAGQ